MGSEPGDTNKPEASAADKNYANGKGKGKGKDMARDESGQEADGDSVMARIGKSAAGLSRSVFQGTPTANELASAGTPGKVEASSSSSSSFSGIRPDTVAESSSTARASSSTEADAPGFRSGQADAHAAAQEAAFSDFLDNTDVFVPAENGFETAWQAASSTASKPTDHGPLRGEAVSSVAEQQERDGLAVVDLLSRTDEEMPRYEEEQTSLSETELRNLRQALFEDGSPAQLSASDWNNILNFVPDFLRGQDDEHGGRTEPAGASYMNLGVTNTAEAGQLWLEEWNRVLTGYADEVWGDLADLVREARTNVEQAREKSQDEDGQKPKPKPDVMALRRLQSVLTRVRARL